MKKKHKNAAIIKLSDHLGTYHPSLEGLFMCPVCLNKIPLQKESDITRAHIIPDVAGGKLKTFLCKVCNDKFGSKQDKWFGEYVRLSNIENAGILDSNYLDKYFYINDIKIKGTIESTADGIFIYYLKDKNPPDNIKRLSNTYENNPGKMTLKLSYKRLLDNERLIGIGYLTAGYLMWFDALSYSWVFQSHLDIIRRQILNPDEDIISPKIIFFEDGMNWQPWIGFVKLVGGDIYPAIGLTSEIVLFPSKYLARKYSKLRNVLSPSHCTKIIKLDLQTRLLEKSGLVIVDDELVIAPDIAYPEKMIPLFISFETGEISFGQQITEDSFNRMKSHGDIEIKRYNL